MKYFCAFLKIFRTNISMNLLNWLLFSIFQPTCVSIFSLNNSQQALSGQQIERQRDRQAGRQRGKQADRQKDDKRKQTLWTVERGNRHFASLIAYAGHCRIYLYVEINLLTSSKQGTPPSPPLLEGRGEATKWAVKQSICRVFSSLTPRKNANVCAKNIRNESNLDTSTLQTGILTDFRICIFVCTIFVYIHTYIYFSQFLRCERKQLSRAPQRGSPLINIINNCKYLSPCT